MRIVLSANGRFHIFDLARQLMRHGVLKQLFTGYPNWKIDNDLRSHTTSFPWFLVLQLTLRQTGFNRLAGYVDPIVHNALDRWVATRMPECDLFVSLSTDGLQSMKRAHSRGIKVVCDRGSTHIREQNELLLEEYRRFDLPFKGISQWTIEREEAEYDEADVITVPSRFNQRSFLKHGIDTSKVKVLPYGVELTEFHKIPKHDKKFRVLFVGRLSIRKGLVYLLEAFRKFRQADVELLLVGALDREIEPLLSSYEGQFQYLGTKPRKQLYQIFSSASVLVLPSIEEGMATVQAQAMACGLPVIATDHTGSEDLFIDGREGFIVPIRDSDAICEKLNYLYENPDRLHEMGQSALAHMKKIGGWDTYGDNALLIYKKIVQC